MAFYSPPLGRFSTDSQLGLWYSTWIFSRFIIKLIGSIISRFSGKKEPASIALNAAVIIRQDSSQRQLQLVLYRLVCPSHLSVLLPQCSLNFIRLRLVVITPPVTMLLRGENDSKQSDEIQTPAGGGTRYILGWGGAARLLIPRPCLRQKSLIFLPCLRQKYRKTYPGWPHVPIKPL